MSLLRFSEAVSLAFHALAVVALGNGELVSTAQIANAISASEAHLSKVMQRLVKAGIVNSTRGPRGGFALVRDPKDITLMSIYEAIDGTLKGTDCLMSVPLCDGKTCVLGRMIGEVNSIVIKNLSCYNLSHLKKSFEEKKNEA